MLGYAGEYRPQLSDLDRCTRCGLCEQACPTYKLLHFEPDSPRGRVFLMKQVAEGAADVDLHLSEHLYQCLGCRACETVCPAGVPYGKLLERARFQIEQRGELAPSRRGWRRFRSLAFERVLPTPWLFRTAMFPAQALQHVPPLLHFAQGMPLPRKFAQLVRMIPRRQTGRSYAATGSNRPAVVPAIGKSRARVGLFLGCVMRSLFSRVHEATVRALTHNGCDVVIPLGQWCCGALNVHAGERDHAARMARRNLEAFAKVHVDAIIVNSAGCGAVMKEYGELLGDDDSVSAFAAKVRDVTEFLGQLELRPALRSLYGRVTYQDACHLVHGQRVRRQPRDLLKQIPGLQFVELGGADECCGAAGVYSLTHPEFASSILEPKLDALAATGADVLATANPGCAMQLQAGLLSRKMSVRVCHVVELLAESYTQGP